MAKKKRIKTKSLISLIIIIGLIIYILFYFIKPFFSNNNTKDIAKMIDLSDKSIEEIKKYATENKLDLDIKYDYNDEISKNNLINQNIKINTILKENDKLIITISKGKIDSDTYKEYSVDELGNVPIMMYHGIENKTNDETKYTGGNIDSDGYNRTTEAFINDLEFYYDEGYRMIRLVDYVNGEINVELGKSPIVITFDDGNENNIKVTGKDKDGNIIIDPNSAVGILEKFRSKYPDYNVTATFFVMDGLFNQPEYNEDILKWLVNHGYDVGNHTKNHINYRTANATDSESQTGYMYEKLENIIPGKYVKIIALPFGSPGNKEHPNFKYVLNGIYNGKEYNTISALRVGWMSELSPFNKSFDKTFIKRIRAWDNNGMEFDIQMVFNQLKTTKYISDGDKNKIVIPNGKKDKLIETNKTIIEY